MARGWSPAPNAAPANPGSNKGDGGWTLGMLGISPVANESATFDPGTPA
jgi:hypothetical protein